MNKPTLFALGIAVFVIGGAVSLAGSPQLPAQFDDLRIVTWPFDAAIRAVIFVGSVSIIFAVRFVVFVLVADKVR